MPDHDWRAEERERERWERQGTPPRDWPGDPAAIYQERSFQPPPKGVREAPISYGDYNAYGYSYGERPQVFGERESGFEYRGGPRYPQGVYDPSAGPDYGRQGFGSGRYAQGGYDEPTYERRGYGQGGFGPSNFRQGEGYDRQGHWWDRAADRMQRWLANVDRERSRDASRHRGKGPKNYVRPDDRIRDDAHNRLTEDPYIDASEIELKVEAGELTLGGYVDTREAKHHAEHCVEDIPGVRHVQNNLRVQTHGGRDEDPAWTAHPIPGGALETKPS